MNIPYSYQNPSHSRMKKILLTGIVLTTGYFCGIGDMIKRGYYGDTPVATAVPSTTSQTVAEPTTTIEAVVTPLPTNTPTLVSLEPSPISTAPTPATTRVDTPTEKPREQPIKPPRDLEALMSAGKFNELTPEEFSLLAPKYNNTIKNQNDQFYTIRTSSNTKAYLFAKGEDKKRAKHTIYRIHARIHPVDQESAERKYMEIQDHITQLERRETLTPSERQELEGLLEKMAPLDDAYLKYTLGLLKSGLKLPEQNAIVYLSPELIERMTALDYLDTQEQP